MAETVTNIFPLCASMESRNPKYGASHDSNDSYIEHRTTMIHIHIEKLRCQWSFITTSGAKEKSKINLSL